MTDFTQVTLEDDCDVIVVVPSDGLSAYVLEHDPSCAGYEELLDLYLSGWPELAEVCEDSIAREAKLSLWVGSEALGNDLNGAASALAGFDIYGAAFICRRSPAAAGMQPIPLSEVKSIFADLNLTMGML